MLPKNRIRVSIFSLDPYFSSYFSFYIFDFWCSICSLLNTIDDNGTSSALSGHVHTIIVVDFWRDSSFFHRRRFLFGGDVSSRPVCCHQTRDSNNFGIKYCLLLLFLLNFFFFWINNIGNKPIRMRFLFRWKRIAHRFLFRFTLPEKQRLCLFNAFGRAPIVLQTNDYAQKSR